MRFSWYFLSIKNLHTHTNTSELKKEKSWKIYDLSRQCIRCFAAADDVISKKLNFLRSSSWPVCCFSSRCWWFIDENPIKTKDKKMFWSVSSPPFCWPKKQYFFVVVSLSLFVLHQQSRQRCGDVIGNSLTISRGVFWRVKQVFR